MPGLFDYQVVCHRDTNGSYVAYVPALPGCQAVGDSPNEAQMELENVFAMIREEYAEQGKVMPADVELTVTHAG